jgi:hypothetical protein
MSPEGSSAQLQEPASVCPTNHMVSVHTLITYLLKVFTFTPWSLRRSLSFVQSTKHLYSFPLYSVQNSRGNVVLVQMKMMYGSFRSWLLKVT